MASFWSIVNHVIIDADVILLVLDARLIKETQNKEIEDKVKEQRKKIVYVINKCDLVDKNDLEKYKKRLRPCVFVSSTEYHGLKLLRERILIEGHKKGITREKIKVGVLGYPNVGKSSLINALRGKKSAKASALSGCTTGVQKIKTDNRIIMLDTPGVIPYNEKNFMKHAKIGTLDFTKTQEPDMVVIDLMGEFAGSIEKYYGVPIIEDFEETIELIANNKKIFKKGAQPDILRMSRMILTDWQRGLIKTDND